MPFRQGRQRRAGSSPHSRRLLSLRSLAVCYDRFRCWFCQTSGWPTQSLRRVIQMEILTSKATRRSTRLRVEIPVTVTSLDRKHPFSAQCMVLVVSPQGCGFRSPQAFPLETPLLLNDLPGGGTASARVANCLPLGIDGKNFLIGVSLYNHGNVWRIVDPPEDWNCAPATAAGAAAGADKITTKSKGTWPYNKFSDNGETRSGRK